MREVFIKGEHIEWSAGGFEQLAVIDVIEDRDFANTYAILFQNEEYAAAFSIHEERDEGSWYFVVDDEKAWVSEKHIALAHIVIAMHEMRNL